MAKSSARTEIRATVLGGLRILEKIERAGYDVFRQRPVLIRGYVPVIAGALFGTLRTVSRRGGAVKGE